MNEYEAKLMKYIKDNKISAEHLSFKQSCHSVEEAAQSANASKEDFVKNICLINSDGDLIVAIIKGEDKVDISKIEKKYNTKKLRFATKQEILDKTGYPCGGTPSFGSKAKFLIDSKVMEKDTVYSGGGSENSLVKISTIELQKSNKGKTFEIRK